MRRNKTKRDNLHWKVSFTGKDEHSSIWRESGSLSPYAGRAEECEKWQGVNLQCGNSAAEKTGNLTSMCQRDLGTHWGLCEFASALTAAPQKPNLEKRLGSETDTLGLCCA